MTEVEFAVVGAGPAGLSAAIEAARSGAEVVVLDENERPGGQLFKQIHKFLGSRGHRAGLRGVDIGQQLLQETRKFNVRLWLNAVVWGIFDGPKLGVRYDGRVSRFSARKVLLATGASENAVAFPGWTLPGVMGAGAAQTLINIHRVLPGRRVLMVGAGNVGLIIAYQLLQAGAQVVAVVEALPHIGGYGVHASKLRRCGVPILTSHTVKEAIGANRVERAIVAAVDSEVMMRAGTEKSFDVDTICLAVGLTPMAELAWLAGCEFTYAPERGGHIPLCDEDMLTTVEGIHVAGDLTGIEEAHTAMEEGKLAGIAVAESLGYLERQEALMLKRQARAHLEALSRGPFRERREKSSGATAKEGMARKGTLERTGVLSSADLMGSPGMPTRRRMEEGPVALIECTQEIPCDPCVAACPHGAIGIGEDITRPPRLIGEKCTGCAACIAHCPGQAIYGVHLNYSPEGALLMIPYEFYPLPKAHSTVMALDREGKVVGQAKVLKVSNRKKNDRTPVIWLLLARELTLDIRSIRF